MRAERACMNDVAAVMTLERETAEAPHWNQREYCAAVLGDDADPRRCLLVVRDEGELLGFAVGHLVAGVGEMESVAVRASSRRLGVGRMLCMAVIAWAWRHGAATVELEVRAGSMGPRALYTELGFVECGRRVGYYSAPMEDAVLMRLEPVSVETASL